MARAGPSDIKSFVATGDVRHQDRRPGRHRAIAPSSTRTTQILQLTGNVTVVNASGTVSGPDLLINLANNTSIFTGGKGGRVTGVFTPQ